MVQLSQPYMTTGKTIALTILTFVGRVMFLLFNTLSRFVIDFLFLGSKVTADGDSSHEIRGHLLLGRKAMTNLDSVLKS